MGVPPNFALVQTSLISFVARGKGTTFLFPRATKEIGYVCTQAIPNSHTVVSVRAEERSTLSGKTDRGQTRRLIIANRHIHKQ